MSNKKLGMLLLSIAIGFIVGFGAWKLTADKKEPAPTTTTQQPQQSTTNNSVEAPAEASFTAEEVAKHNSQNDCWTIIDGSVYDLTSYIPNHPGGKEILRACGADGSSLFKSRETNSGEAVGSGNPHSSNAASQLANLKVGTLKQ